MKIILRQKPEGIAIFIVLVSIIILGGMAGVFAYNMRVETQLAMNSNNETEMEWLGRSGVELAEFTLGQEMSTPGPGQRYDALNQKWAGGEGETNDAMTSINLTDVPLGHGKLSVTITDAERKININTAANNEALMTQALILIGTDASEIPTIIASVQDWIDRDDDTHVNGAESDYYRTLDPPYSAKNGPIDDLSELLLVKGVTPDIYWGPNSTNHPPTMFQGRTAGARSGTQPNAPLVSAGLVDIFTPVSSGQLNINTCSASTLRMIGLDETTANKIVSLRAGPDGVDGTADDMPFSNPGEIINAGLPPQLASQFLPYLTVRSFTFEVHVDVTVGQTSRRYFALVRRNTPRDFQILTMYWE
jgi:general secretion pathway protein K